MHGPLRGGPGSAAGGSAAGPRGEGSLGKLGAPSYEASHGLAMKHETLARAPPHLPGSEIKCVVWTTVRAPGLVPARPPRTAA
eukprot:2942542-Prymnesium_polylepis.1